jgi:Tol biopolymer transport system component
MNTLHSHAHRRRVSILRVVLLTTGFWLLAAVMIPIGRALGREAGLTFLYRRGAESDIMMLDVARAHLHPLTRHPAADRDPVWSPDGRRLAFVSDRGGQAQLYLLGDGISSREIAPLVPSRIAPGYRPVWSPDGRFLAVEFFRGTVGIYLIDTRCVRLTPPCPITRLTESATDDRFPAWSPDGERIAFVSWRDGDAEIYTVRPDGSDLRNLTQDRGWDVSPAWSPDGTQVAFFSDRDRYPELYVMRADGSDVRKLTDDNNPTNTQASGAPVWSPDGTWLAYVVTFEGNTDVMIIDPSCADGGSAACLSRTWRIAANAASDFAPFWSPDGRYIQFLSDRHGQFAVYRADPACPQCAPQRLTGENYTSAQASWHPAD